MIDTSHGLSFAAGPILNPGNDFQHLADARLGAGCRLSLGFRRRTEADGLRKLAFGQPKGVGGAVDINQAAPIDEVHYKL